MVQKHVIRLYCSKSLKHGVINHQMRPWHVVAPWKKVIECTGRGRFFLASIKLDGRPNNPSSPEERSKRRKNQLPTYNHSMPWTSV